MSVNIDKSLVHLLTYFQLFVFVYVLWDVYTTPASLKAGLQAYVLGAYVSIGSLISNYHVAVDVPINRLSATGFNPNEVAMILALGMPVAWHLALFEYYDPKTYWLRLINYAYIPAAFLAILLTSSRAASFSTLPVFLFMLGTLTRVKAVWRVLVSVVLIGSLFALLSVVPQSSLQRLGNYDLHGRKTIWRESIVIISEHPVGGAGSGAYKSAAVETRKGAHNLALSLLGEIGIVGFTLFCTIIAMAFYHVRYLPKPSRGLWLAILLVWLINNTTHNLEDNKQIWLFLGLLLTSASLYSRPNELRRSIATPTHLA